MPCLPIVNTVRRERTRSAGSLRTGRDLRTPELCVPGARSSRPSRVPEELTMGNFKVFVLMAGLTALFGALGGYIGGAGGPLSAPPLPPAVEMVLYFCSA